VLEVRRIAGHGPAARPRDGAIHGKRETMRAVLRLTVALFAAALSLAPSLALAQNSAQPPGNTASPDTVGPRELQNFNLNGTVTRPADTMPAPVTQAPKRQPSTTPVESGATTASSAPTSRRATAQPPAIARGNPAPARAEQSPSLGPSSTAHTTTTAAGASQPAAPPADDATSTPPAPDQKFLLWPWLLLAGLVGAAAAFFLWRRSTREALADGPSIESYVAPEPAPQPAPRAAPAPLPSSAPTPKPSPPAGIVSSRLRPWIDIAFAPLGCLVEDERVTIEFEVHLHNSGTALARDILVEASMFNAGPTQDQDIGRFFAEPAGQGERIATLPPLQTATIRTALVAPRANIQLFELGGRLVFVPLIAFNALYRLGGGRGQTSASYMLGRESKGDKLSPLRLDLGPRAFTKLGIKPLPNGVRQ
jgi:hypothetical protein